MNQISWLKVILYDRQKHEMADTYHTAQIMKCLKLQIKSNCYIIKFQEGGGGPIANLQVTCQMSQSHILTPLY